MILVMMWWWCDDDDEILTPYSTYTSFMYEYISVWWIVSMFILDRRSIGVFRHFAEEERRWRTRPPQRQSCLSATTCSNPATVFSRMPGRWKHLFLNVMDKLPLRPGHRHPSTASFSLSTNDTTVRKVSSVPFPTSGSHDADASN